MGIVIKLKIGSPNYTDYTPILILKAKPKPNVTVKTQEMAILDRTSKFKIFRGKLAQPPPSYSGM